MTQVELANKLHITDKAISKWERGLSSPDIELLQQLADTLGVSISDLLNGEQIDEDKAEDTSSVKEVLHYAENTIQKKIGAMKLILSLGFTALMLIGIIVCSIVDVAITKRFTWSLYPISAMVFAWCVLFPVIYWSKEGIVPSMLIFTILVVPYLFILDKIAATEGVILRVGTVIAVISLVFLWIVWFVMKQCKNRKILGAGISALLAVPIIILINYSLTFTFAPKSGAFDVWDVFNIAILLIVGFVLIGFDLIIKKKSS